MYLLFRLFSPVFGHCLRRINTHNTTIKFSSPTQMQKLYYLIQKNARWSCRHQDYLHGVKIQRRTVKKVKFAIEQTLEVPGGEYS